MKSVLLALLSGCFTLLGHAETRTLAPIDDARTSVFEADTNLNDVVLFTAESFPNRVQYSYLKFDLSVIPSNEVIVGATLNLFQVGAQVVRISPAASRFAHELVDLLHQNHGLELLHSVVAAASEELLLAPEASGGSPDVVKGVAPV